MTYTSAERECIGLCVALEAIGDMVNHALLIITDVDGLPGEAEVRFPTRAHEQLFLVRLLDFAKEGGDADVTGVTGSCLDVLKSACASKSFDLGGSLESLNTATNSLDVWLSADTSLRLWLPTLDLDVQLKVPRIEFLYISGNYAKHNLSRLTGVSKRIARILSAHGHNVPLEHLPLALEDFGGNLEEDYFVYYGTWIAELLNNVRWGLQDYLLPTFHRSYIKHPGELRYEYKYPGNIVNDVPRAWFWRLMNHVRSGPYVHRFSGARYMKKEILR